MSLRALEVALSPMACWIHDLKYKTPALRSGLHPSLTLAACTPGSAEEWRPGPSASQSHLPLLKWCVL